MPTKDPLYTTPMMSLKALRRRKGYQPFGGNNPVYDDISMGSNMPDPEVLPMSNMSPVIQTGTLSDRPTTLPFVPTNTIDPSYDPGAASKTDTPNTTNAPFLTPKQAAIAAIPGTVGGLVSGFKNWSDFNKVRRRNLIPEAVQQGADQRFLAEKSAKAADYSAASDQITQDANIASGNVMTGATTPQQAIQGASNIQANKNNAFRSLSGRGAIQQLQNRNSADNYRKLLGEYKTMENNQYANEKASLRNAMMKNFGGTLNTVSQAALMGVA